MGKIIMKLYYLRLLPVFVLLSAAFDLSDAELDTDNDENIWSQERKVEEICGVMIHNISQYKSNQSEVIYCFLGHGRKEIHKIFGTIQLKIQSQDSNFDYLKTNSLETFTPKGHALLEFVRSFISRPLVYMNETTENLSPFEDTFVKVSMKDENKSHVIFIKEFWFDKSLFFRFIFGIFLFSFAKTMCRHMSFIYFTGFSLGLFISWLFLLLLLVKFLPAKKGLVTAVLMFGTQLGLYIAHSLLDNFINLILCYQTIFMWYVGIVGLLTFGAMYYYDPARNVRFLNLVQWTLQLFGCYMVFIGTRIEEVSVTVIVFMVSTYIGVQFVRPSRVARDVALFCLPYKLRYKLFKPKRRLLTQDEYRVEGLKSKTKGLVALREYCSSPESSPWKLVSRLKDPKRFALFMDSGLDLSQDEIDRHDQWEESASTHWFTSDDETRNTSITDDDSSLTDCVDEEDTELEQRH